MNALARLKAWLVCPLPALAPQPFTRTPPDAEGIIRPKPDRKDCPALAAEVWKAQIQNATMVRR